MQETKIRKMAPMLTSLLVVLFAGGALAAWYFQTLDFDFQFDVAAVFDAKTVSPAQLMLDMAFSAIPLRTTWDVNGDDYILNILCDWNTNVVDLYGKINVIGTPGACDVTCSAKLLEGWETRWTVDLDIGSVPIDGSSFPLNNGAGNDWLLHYYTKFRILQLTFNFAPNSGLPPGSYTTSINVELGNTA